MAIPSDKENKITETWKRLCIIFYQKHWLTGRPLGLLEIEIVGTYNMKLFVNFDELRNFS
jgi:hypothetical protein